jgi:hypothetical protein
LKLSLKLGEVISPLWESVRQVGRRSDAAKLGCYVVNYWLPSVVHLGLPQFPRLIVSDHGIKLLDGSNESILGILENLGVSMGSKISIMSKL